MRMKRNTQMISVIIIFITISIGHAQNQSWNMNFKGGVMLPGTVTIEGYDVDTEMGWIINTAYDAMVAEKFSMGGYLFYSGIESEGGEPANILAIGGTLKGRFTMQSGTQIRPGLILAYQMTTGDAFDDVTGLDVGFTFEVAFPLKKKHTAIVGELGFTSQPAGGNEDADVTWAPVFYITIGYEFGG